MPDSDEQLWIHRDTSTSPVGEHRPTDAQLRDWLEEGGFPAYWTEEHGQYLDGMFAELLEKRARVAELEEAGCDAQLQLRDLQAELQRTRIERDQIAMFGPKVTSETSDGYHTFAELYRYRMLYNAALFNEWARLNRYDVHKSWRHSDGEKCFGGGWFVVSAQLPAGQITNHYEATDWDLFRIPERETAAEWDGHTPEQVAERLAALLADMPSLLREQGFAAPSWWFKEQEQLQRIYRSAGES